MILSVTELKNRSGAADEKNQTTYKRTFRVLMSSPNDGPYLAMNGPGIYIGEQYQTGTEYDTLSYCKGVSADCISDDGLTYEVVVEYGPRQEQDEDNPLNEPAEISWSFNNRSKNVDYDVYGAPIINTAGDPFNEPIEIDDPRPVLTVKRNERHYPVSIAYQYRNAVNSTGFFGASSGQVKVLSITSARKYHQKIGFYWETTYQFEFALEGWDRILLDHGLREIDSQTGKPKPIMSGTTPVSDPVMLNGSGVKAAPGENPYWLKFKVYPRLPFSVFNF